MEYQISIRSRWHVIRNICAQESIGWPTDSADFSWAQWGSTMCVLAGHMGTGCSKITFIKTTSLSHASRLTSGSRVPKDRREQQKPS